MKEQFVFIYDGECPFCNHFAELIELRSGLTNISVLNGRENLPLITNLLEKGFDLNDGAILLKGEEILHGARAINFICSQIVSPSSSLLKLLKSTFSSQKRTNFLFPFLVIARRFALRFKGVPIRLLP